MNEPELKDYDLMGKDIESIKKKSESLFIEPDCLGPLGMYILFPVIVSLLWYTGLPFGLVFILSILLTIIACWITYRLISPSTDKDVSNYRKYAEAKNNYENWLYRQKESFWFSMTGRRFEQEICQALEKANLKPELTPASDDKGIDIYLQYSQVNEAKYMGEQKIGIQCKAHRNPVGPAVAREFYGAMMDTKCDKGILVCLGGFTKGVHEFVRNKPIMLWTVKDVIKFSESPQPSALKGSF